MIDPATHSRIEAAAESLEQSGRAGPQPKTQ